MGKLNSLGLTCILVVSVSKPHSELHYYEPRPLLCNHILQSQTQQHGLRTLHNHLRQQPTSINENYNGCPILFHTIYWKCWLAFDFLLDLHQMAQSHLNLDLSKQYGPDNDSILHALVACKAPRIVVSKLLVSYPRAILKLNNKDETALETALLHGDQANTVATLAMHGAHIRKKTFAYAEKNKRTESIAVLERVLVQRIEERERAARSERAASYSDDEIIFRGDFDNSPETMV